MSPKSKHTDIFYARYQRLLQKTMSGGKVPRKFRPLIDAFNATYKINDRSSMWLPIGNTPPSDEKVVWGPSVRAAMRRTTATVRTPRRARARAARRSTVTRSAAARGTASGADPPPPAEPPASRALVAPVLVTDAPAMAAILAAAVGLTPRQLRELVVERGIRHTRPGRNVYVRVDDLVAALGLSGASSATPPSTGPGLSDDEVVTLACSDEGSR
jgi:hypothetical protein